VSTTVLVVEDSDIARSAIRQTLEDTELDLRVVEAADGAEAVAMALGGGIDLVITDILMPKLDGVQLLRAIRQKLDADALPVILVTSQTDVETRSQSFESGASDYLTKPFSPAELVSRVQVQLRLRALQEELKRANERYRVLVVHDELTGLANRRHFFDLCRRELARSRRHRFAMAVAVLDVDGFREVNTRVGYLVGDAVISEIAVVVGQALRTTDVLARLGGEKFAALLPQTDALAARVICERLCEIVRGHAFPSQQAGQLTLSVGSATYSSGGIETVDELLNAAESSLDRAKELGGGRAEVYDAPVK